ncbi:3-mercaptopyruvate sulfurtransferase [Xanthobacter dioxanivorans]|uniref:3-mercaptopyruvate sulfurtransferase n=1 Tax=Xanthobacter dioxanivorans TaxID=2528964 RepID=A0A974SI81_9HYPH|nr:3-mercaptopyruvate sulfurtransferase [Xanthobacter dioxanivorans]QRG05889.1 3-mercaptopyruvate sulfurtransferase [Xanthobacter dioxanivorans]
MSATADTSASPFVSTEWLAANLGAPDLVVVDASWHMPNAGRDGRKEYLERHIPGAVHFDIDTIADHSTSLPHMLPDPHSFAVAMGALGIGDGLRVVVYDSLGLFSAPRVWWTFRAFGAQDVKILDGGLPKWLAEERPVEDGPVRRLPAIFTARLDHSIVADIERVDRALKTGGAQVLDARQDARFRGEAPEPREGLPSGHMPGALNLPHGRLVKDGRLLPPEEILEAVEASGLDLSRPVITSCGSGVSAAILWVALEMIGKEPLALYDGSWTEWGASGKEIAVG